MNAAGLLYCSMYNMGMDNNRKRTHAQKPKMGRPSLGSLAKRGIFTIRVHEDELAQWRRLAAESGVTLTDFVVGPLRELLAKRKVE